MIKYVSPEKILQKYYRGRKPSLKKKSMTSEELNFASMIKSNFKKYGFVAKKRMSGHIFSFYCPKKKIIIGFNKEKQRLTFLPFFINGYKLFLIDKDKYWIERKDLYVKFKKFLERC